MKKTVFFIALFILAFTIPAAGAYASPATAAESMILIHADSGKVLQEKNPDRPMRIASTTKIMTALVAIENLELDREVVIQPLWTRIEGSSMYLRAGESYTVRELLYGLMLSSGNDAAMALACTAAASVDEFAAMMNEKASALGLENTHFTNPHGLDDDTHRASARDMAILMAEAMKNDTFAAITSAKSFSTHGVTYVNHNKLLWRCEGVNGGKTGYTKAAGRCLVSSCERDGLSLICVTLSDSNDWEDHGRLYDWACEQFVPLRIPYGVSVETVPVVVDSIISVGASPMEDISLCIPRGSTVETSVELPRFVFPSVYAGDQAGTISVSVNGEEQGSWSLYWDETIFSPAEMRKTFLEKIGRTILGVYYM